MRVFTFILSFLFILPFLSGAAVAGTPAKHFLNIQEVVSPGGIHAWLVEDHSVPVISMDFAFAGAGSALDGKKQGLAQIVSNTLDEGAGKLDSTAFQKALSDNSISLGFAAGRDNFSGSLKTLTRKENEAFKLLGLALHAPRFDAAPVERMKAANLARIRSSLSDPDWMAARIMNDLAFAGHPYAQNSGGTLTSLKTITPADLRGFTKDFLTRDRLRVAVAGDIDKAALGKALDEIFGGLPRAGKAAPVADLRLQNTGVVALYKRDIPQTIILMTQAGLQRKDPDWPTLQVMNYILGGGGFGSRLMNQVREKRGLTYGIYTSPSDLDHIATLTLSTSTRNEKAAEVLKLIHKEWVRMRSTDVSAKELTAAKDYLIGSMPLALTSTGNISGMMLGMMLDKLPVTYLDGIAGKISAVTAGNVRALADRLLTPGKMVTVLVGQPVGVTPTKIVQKLPNAE